ncbi:hypothetical protein ABT116_03720 [Streptomyces sp. NPDC002130]|uniref:hypothetical protein n=1 Tax=Streptomyces sp. NPDC002130 TaxID=3155568 RepID=UPI003320BE8F
MRLGGKDTGQSGRQPDAHQDRSVDRFQFFAVVRGRGDVDECRPTAYRFFCQAKVLETRGIHHDIEVSNHSRIRAGLFKINDDVSASTIAPGGVRGDFGDLRELFHQGNPDGTVATEYQNLRHYFASRVARVRL